MVEFESHLDNYLEVRALRKALYAIDVEAAASPDRSCFVLDRFKGLRVEVFANEHPPPHFRVWCPSDAANYRISDCEQLNGGLRKYYSVVRRWHGQNKQALIETWNQLRPSGCPVGEYREP